MARAFGDSLVLIVGSGAGGGTLGNELAQLGIRTVILEAGPADRKRKAC
jgi:choline dehydrogenase-like flavoprotein